MTDTTTQGRSTDGSVSTGAGDEPAGGEPSGSALRADSTPAAATPPPVERPSGGKRIREQSTIGFVYDDLNAALKLADLVHNRYGGECTTDQLAAASGASPSSGAFRLKVSAGRQFGVLGGGGAQVTTTVLGVNALDEGNSGARADAFLNVPLYRKLYDEFLGSTLPDDSGLEARIRALGVSSKQVSTARQVFARAAEQAGFFAHGRNRLVMPPKGRVGSGAVDPPADEKKDTNEPELGIMKHPLIQGLLAVLPEPAQGKFPNPERQMWLDTLRNSLSFIYGRTEDANPPERHGTSDT